jgi:hypothetical protein
LWLALQLERAPHRADGAIAEIRPGADEGGRRRQLHGAGADPRVFHLVAHELVHDLGVRQLRGEHPLDRPVGSR